MLFYCKIYFQDIVIDNAWVSRLFTRKKNSNSKKQIATKNYSIRYFYLARYVYGSLSPKTL